MKHSSYTAQCGVCKQNAGEVDIPGGVIWENSNWLVRHGPPPSPLVGWTMFHAQRHVQGPAHFNDAEAAQFGPVLRHVSSAIEQVTGAPRVYFVAFGESVPHMHAHLIPRYADMPQADVAFGVADILRSTAKGERAAADPAKALDFAAKLKAFLIKNPPPK
ncbi:MAG: diadenosine tetraphosphate hydrolase [Dehalococcoidia bacterium]|nr:diadenosine tetraphosphate hydrolase [Dehalococcoidia bacterium]